MLSEDLQNRISTRLKRFPLFNAAEYILQNDDLRLAGIDGLSHFASYGVWEGRPFIKNTSIARLLGSLHAEDPQPDCSAWQFPGQEDLAEALLWSAQVGPVGVFVSSNGNFFMRDIALQILKGFSAIGVQATLLDENGDPSGRPRISIYVAPHEFFWFGNGSAWLRANVISEAFILSVEQCQTFWFTRSLPIVLAAKGIIDIFYQNFQLFAKAGIPTLFYNPGVELEDQSEGTVSHPMMAGLSRDARQSLSPVDVWRRRPIDLFFVGGESLRRERVLVSLAPTFAKYPSVVHYRRLMHQPVVSDDRCDWSAFNSYVSRRAKIVLNIHRDEFGFFEWHRMVMHGFRHRALVVSDPSLRHPIFKPNVHYLEEEERYIPELVEWLLQSKEGQLHAETVRNEAYTALAERSSSIKAAAQLLLFLYRNSRQHQNCSDGSPAISSAA